MVSRKAIHTHTHTRHTPRKKKGLKKKYKEKQSYHEGKTLIQKTLGECTIYRDRERESTHTPNGV